MIALSPHVLVRVACASLESLEPFEQPDLAPVLEASERAEARWSRARGALEDDLFALAGGPVDEPGRARRRFRVLALRRDVHAGRAGAWADLSALAEEGGLREERVREWRAALEGWEQARAEASAALARAEDRVRRAAAARLEDPLLREGLRLVGRSLFERAERLRRREPAAWRAADRQGFATVLEYAARMATKTSPNTVFCATSLGAWGDAAGATGTARPARVLARLNIAEARKLLAPLLDDPAFARDRIGLNPSLCREPGALAWWRGASLDDPEALERRVRAAATPPLVALVERLEACVDEDGDGPERAELVAWASQRAGQDASGWIGRLARAGLLVDRDGVPHLEPRPLGWAAARARVRQRAAREAPGWVEAVELVESRVDAIGRACGSDERIRALDEVASAARALSAARPLDEDALVRLDAAAALDVTLPRAVGAEIRRVLPRYARVFAALYPPSVRLAPFRSRFLARHRADADVPLAELFHGVFDDFGSYSRASYPDPARLAPGEADAEVVAARETHARFRRFFQERLSEGDRAAREELELTDADWDHLAGASPAPAFSCGLLFQLVPHPRAGVAGGRVVWNGIFGPGLALSRLSALHPAASPGELSPLARVALDGWAALVPQGAVPAEIPYGHAGRTANAGLRASVFPDEIALPGETPTPGARTFPLSDLLVRYDSATRRFAIRSRRRGVIVVPVLTSGLSPEGFIAFLIAVGQQDAPPLALFPDVDDAWPGAVPRVVSGRTVLFRRRWSFAPEATAEAFGGGDALDRLCRVGRLARERGIPPRVFASSLAAPKPRYVHLGSTAFLPVLEELAAGGSPLVVREMLPAPADAWFRDAEGRHALEFLAHIHATGGGAS